MENQENKMEILSAPQVLEAPQVTLPGLVILTIIADKNHHDFDNFYLRRF